jgi:hypothetical protein
MDNTGYENATRFHNPYYALIIQAGEARNSKKPLRRSSKKIKHSFLLAPVVQLLGVVCKIHPAGNSPKPYRCAARWCSR